MSEPVIHPLPQHAERSNDPDRGNGLAMHAVPPAIRRGHRGAVDPRLVAIAAQVEEETHGGPLRPAKALLAEMVYGGKTRKQMYAFVERAGIPISYSGMLKWLQRNFGKNGPEAMARAREVLLEAAASGEYRSSLIPLAPATAAAPHESAAPVEASMDALVDGAQAPRSTSHAMSPTAAATPRADAVCADPRPGASERGPADDASSAVATRLGTSQAGTFPTSAPVQGGQRSTTSGWQAPGADRKQSHDAHAGGRVPLADASETEQGRQAAKERRLAAGRAALAQRARDNPFWRIANRQPADERSE